jgi:cobalt-zinc-cadmium efflux system membrane fusion protein
MKTILIPVIILTLFSCGAPKNEPSTASDDSYSAIQLLSDSSNAEVDAITAATRTNNQLTFNGILVVPPQRHASVTLLMDGVVKSTSLLSGMFVRKGDLLAVLENPDYITLQQSYIENHAQETFLEAEYRRQEMLFGNEAASQKTFQQSKADYLSMKSRREAVAAQLRLLGFDPAQTLADGIVPHLELRAPIDGYIANVQINIGKFIARGNTVCDIIDKNNALLKLTVYEKDIEKIKMGDKMEFRVNGLGTRVFEASVISLGQMVDIVSRSLEVYARVNSGDAQFRPGMYVNARIVTEKEF